MDEQVVELSVDQCWQLLAQEEFGRLAYRLVDEVHIVPLNYLADGRALLFRTAPGNKLLAAALHSDVAFEIDWLTDRAAWSVVVRGSLHRLAEDEERRADTLPLHPWVPGARFYVIELIPEQVTGRRFQLEVSETDHALPLRT